MDARALPHQCSFGVFTSNAAVDSVSRGDVRRLYLTSNTQLNFSNKDAGEGPGESCLAIYESGRLVRHLRQRHAPLHARSMTRYGSEYYDKPAADFLENKQLAESFRPPQSQSAPELGDGGARTTYGGSFPWMDAEKLRLAKLESQKPGPLDKSERVMGGVGVSLEKAPVSQQAFVPWPLKVQGETRPLSAVHSRPREHYCDFGEKSQYRLSFSSKQTVPGLPPQAKPKRLHRGASVPQPGGTSLRMKHLSDRQSDYLIATRSFSRGFGVPPR